MINELRPEASVHGAIDLLRDEPLIQIYNRKYGVTNQHGVLLQRRFVPKCEMDFVHKYRNWLTAIFQK